MKIKYSFLISLTIYSQIVCDNFLFFTSPGGEHGKAAGLYGARLTAFGKSKDWFAISYNNLTDEKKELTDLYISGISFDPVTAKTVLEIDSNEKLNDKIIAQANLCEPSQPLEVIANNLKFVSDENPYFKHDQCGKKCGIQGVTYFDSTLFFILSAVFGSKIDSLERKIQVRKMLPCHISDGTLDILHCSELIHTLFTESYEWTQPDLPVWAGDAMLAVQSKNKEIPHIFVQLLNKSRTDSYMNLMKISTNEDDSTEAILLHSVPINPLYSGKRDFKGLGHMSFKDEILCWTNAENVYCGHFGFTDKISNVEVVLTGEEAYNEGVCKGSIDPIPKGKVLTGVAIESARDPFVVYFGCYAQEFNVGGLGVLILSSGYDGIKKTILKISDDENNPILAGDLFILENYTNYCQSGESDGNEIQVSTTVNPCPINSYVNFDFSWKVVFLMQGYILILLGGT